MTGKHELSFLTYLRRTAVKLFVGFVGFLGPFFVASYIFVPILGLQSGQAYHLPLFLVGGLLMLFAYSLQSYLAHGDATRGSQKYVSYESESVGFSLKKASTVFVISLIAAIITAILTHSYLEQRVKDLSFEGDTDFPSVVAALFVFTMMMCGAVAAFYPSLAFITGRGAMICGILMLAGTCICMILSVGLSFVNVVCLVGYGLCLIFGSNELAINRASSGTIAGGLTAEVKAVNISLCTFLVIGVLILFVLLYFVLLGIKTLMTFLFAVILASGAGNEMYEDAEEIANSVSMTVFGSNEPYRTSEFWSIFVFIAVFAFFITLFIMLRNRRRSSVLQVILNLFRKLIDFLLDPIRFFISFNRGSEEEEFDEFTNFIDEKERVRATDWDGKSADTPENWKDFMSAYNSKKTEREKFRFAYRQYVSLMRKKHRGMKDSDTPRRTAKHLIETTQDEADKEQIRTVGTQFEHIEFEMSDADETTRKTTSKLLKIISGELK